ncbi:hypothetical protein F2Q68_00018448 [Brassica cretica]|uniref:Uncharacterized protein n=1 Tax=Brassica cretica TaxID=69181 RepID=A0A8S9HJ02_BRACR|nr:hypothetical protein F2Q68_00018448 [Brassica cretica]
MDGKNTSTIFLACSQVPVSSVTDSQRSTLCSGDDVTFLGLLQESKLSIPSAGSIASTEDALLAVSTSKLKAARLLSLILQQWFRRSRTATTSSSLDLKSISQIQQCKFN